MTKLCACGCGLPAPIATRTRGDRGQKTGDTIPFRKGHQCRIPRPVCPPVLCACGCGQFTKVAPRTYNAVGVVMGRPLRFLRGHQKNNLPTRGYRMAGLKPNGNPAAVHRVRAERALGHPLPPGAVVHHADGSKDPNAQLVICQDATYHQLLHRRMRVKAAGGNPNTDKICGRCKLVKPMTAFGPKSGKSDGLRQVCRPCDRAADAEYRQRRRAS